MSNQWWRHIFVHIMKYKKASTEKDLQTIHEAQRNKMFRLFSFAL